MRATGSPLEIRLWQEVGMVIVTWCAISRISFPVDPCHVAFGIRVRLLTHSVHKGTQLIFLTESTMS